MILHDLLYVVANSGQWKFGSIIRLPILSNAIFRRDGASAAVRTTKAVNADDKESADVKCSAWTAEQRTPPVAHIRTTCEGVAYDHCVVGRRREAPVGLVCDGDILQYDAGFESEFWNDGYRLGRN